MTSLRAELVAGWPRAAVAAALGLGLLISGGLPTATWSRTTGVVLGAVLLGALVVVLVWRSRPGTPDRSVWSRLLAAGVVLGAGALGTAICALLPATRAAAALPVSAAVLLVFPVVYGGLLRWNRYSTSLADPNDALNGSAALLVAVALANIVIERTGGRLAALPDWHLQPLLLAVAAGVIYLGTAATMTVIAGLRRDPRIWLVTAALGCCTVAPLLALLSPTGAPGWTLGVAALAPVLLAVAAAVRPPVATPQPASPVDSTVGAFVLIVVATGALSVEALTDPTWVTTVCAALAAIGPGLRLLVNVRDLAQLSITRQEALTDDLTGLPNRRAVVRRVEDLCATGTPFLLALVDLDKFKEVNDGLGHSAGDDLLRLVSRRLQAQLGVDGLVGRLGGDEFAVVVPVSTTAATAATQLGADLREWASQAYDVGGLRLHIGVSVGVAVHDHPADAGAVCSTQLLRHADVAMYDAKRSGVGAVVYDGSRHADNSGRLALAEELRTALREGQLVLHHQPQVDVATGRTEGVEALVRWQHPTRGLLGPADFLPIAEVHGLMGALTDRVLSEAVAQAARWRREGLQLRMSVNLSASNLLDTGLPERVSGLLVQHGLPASALVLEVTETVLMSDIEVSRTVLAGLAGLGCTVSIDDFGTGYASLTYLRQLPVGELKLDRSFTADLLTDDRTAAILSSTIDLAHQLGLRVVAEGVEQASTLARLEAMACDETQGYLHSRPLTADELRTWLATAGAPARRTVAQA